LRDKFKPPKVIFDVSML